MRIGGSGRRAHSIGRHQVPGSNTASRHLGSQFDSHAEKPVRAPNGVEWYARSGKPFHVTGRKTTPSNGSPVVTKRQSAMISLRASATIIVLRVPLRLSAVRARYHNAARSPSETSESARRVGSCRGGPGRCRLWPALVRAVARRSRPASLLNRRSAPRLCGHAWAVIAPHEPAYQLSRPQYRRFGPIAEPWRGSQSQAAALIGSDELPRSV